MRYIYPAIFTPDKELEGYYVVEFPDIEAAVTQGKNFSDARCMAKDVLSLALMNMERGGRKIPNPTAPTSIQVDGGEIVMLIDADTDAYKKIFRSGRSRHEVWYSPITERNFFVIKDNDDDVCKRLAQILAKISGVNLSKLYE